MFIKMRAIIVASLAALLASLSTGQRIQTVEVGRSRYFISNASPYSPTLNWFLAYQYCRNIGMELMSLEQNEEITELTNFFRDNNYLNSDYWTSGNQLGSAMWIWMSTGQPFNSTFNHWAAGGTPLTKSQQSCMSTQDTIWSPQNCMDSKSFICEQTRCFYYNYVTTNRVSSQGNSSVLPGVTRVTNRPQLIRRPIGLPTRTISHPSQANIQQEEQQTQQNSSINSTQSTTTTPSIVTSTDGSSILKQMTSPAPSQNSNNITTTEVGEITPTIVPSPIKVMPSQTPDPVKVMPQNAQEVKVMPSQTPDQLKEMPQNAQEVKVMPIVSPITDDPSLNTQNNEIVPSDPDLFLRLLQPPNEDFIPGEPQADAAGGVNIMEQLSRKETFSWALDDTTTE